MFSISSRDRVNPESHTHSIELFQAAPARAGGPAAAPTAVRRCVFEHWILVGFGARYVWFARTSSPFQLKQKGTTYMICASDKHIRFFPRVMTRSFAAMLLVS